MIRFYLIKFMILALVISALSSCSNSKSNTNNNTANFSLTAAKPLARCQKVKDTNFSINSAVVLDSSGQVSADWIKMKFNYLSTTATASGNVIRFFKWRVIGSQSYLDSTPLTFATYNLATGQTTATAVNTLDVNQITPQIGLYIQLNDASAQFQVIKMVIYNSSGSIVAQMNSLIPEYLASPTDYQYNSDGTARATILQQMHPLFGQDVSTWTQAQLTQHFDANCF